VLELFGVQQSILITKIPSAINKEGGDEQQQQQIFHELFSLQHDYDKTLIIA
jgi:hypothetical protein